MWTAPQVRRFATALKRAACAIVVCPGRLQLMNFGSPRCQVLANDTSFRHEQ